MRVTRKDVAREANVSTSTVSYVLNGSREFSEETQKKVLDAVKKLNYKPDMIAKSMVSNQTHQMAIVMDSLLNAYYGEIALGFENAAIKEGYFTNICTGMSNLDAYFDSFSSRRIDGALVLAAPEKFQTENLYKLVDSGTKIITGGINDIDIKKVSLIDNNYGEGMRLACEHLYNLGHRKIFYLSALPGGEQYDSRYSVFLDFQKDYLNNNGLDYFVTLGTSYYNGIEDGTKLMKKLLATHKDFTAIICTNDLLAIGAMQALNQVGLKVPQDVSVVGFDNIIYSRFWSPSITSVTHNKYEFGEKAFKILCENIKSNTTSFFKADVELFIGNSTGPVNPSK